MWVGVGGKRRQKGKFIKMTRVYAMIGSSFQVPAFPELSSGEKIENVTEKNAHGLGRHRTTDSESDRQQTALALFYLRMRSVDGGDD